MLDVPFGRYDKNSWSVTVDAVEAFRGYRTPIHDHVYNNIYYGDILEVIDKLPQYDVILLIDVIEHFEKEQGLELVKKLKRHANRCVLISTPAYPAPQEDYNGNEYERHKSRWGPLDFTEHDFSYRFVPICGNGAHLACIWPKAPENAGGFPMPSRGGAKERPLSIGYVLPHGNLTGGLKMLLEQMRLLKARGHNITAIRKDAGDGMVIPDWYRLNVDRQVLVPNDGRLRDHLAGCDVVMAGWVEQLPELAQDRIPVVYWEQGHEWLFGDTGDWSKDIIIRRHLSQCYSQPCHLAAVSPLIADILRVKYGRDAHVIPNGVDTDLYHPAETKSSDTIMLVGHPGLRFKAFDVAFRALDMVWKAGFRFKVNWICQARSNIANCGFPVNVVIKPSQELLADYYRSASMHLFTSWYEGFGMPPLEAMASGIPVVATDCGGIRTFAEPGVNALMGDAGDADSLAIGMGFLFSNPEAAATLAEAGRQTALQFSLDNSAKLVEDYLMSIVS